MIAIRIYDIDDLHVWNAQCPDGTDGAIFVDVIYSARRQGLWRVVAVFSEPFKGELYR